MMTEMVLATGNKGKLAEFQRLLEGLDIQVHSMKEYPEIGEIVEDGDSFAANALIKARAVCKATGKPAMADDSGLMVMHWTVRRAFFRRGLPGNSAVMLITTKKFCSFWKM